MKNSRKDIFAVFLKWLPIGFVVTLLCGLIYVSGQFILRSGANDPQIQIAEDAAHVLGAGAPYSTFSPPSIEKMVYTHLHHPSRHPGQGLLGLVIHGRF